MNLNHLLSTETARSQSKSSSSSTTHKEPLEVDPLDSLEEILSDSQTESTDNETETDSEDSDDNMDNLSRKQRIFQMVDLSLYNYKLLSDLFANINQYKCADCNQDGNHQADMIYV